MDTETIMDSDDEMLNMEPHPKDKVPEDTSKDKAPQKRKRQSKKTLHEVTSTTSTAGQKTYKTIELLENQDTHVTNILKIFSQRPFALDLSMLGAGKTFTSTWIALQHKEQFPHVMIICPVSVEGKWKDMRDTYGLQLDFISSQHSLRSQRFHQPRHGLLLRKDSSVMYGATEINKVEFVSTEKWKTLVREGILLIIDEIQNIKNVSSQFLACQKLIEEIVESYKGPDKKSRVLLLSGSPIDRQEHALHLFRSLHIMTEDRIAQQDFQTQRMVTRGLNQIVDYCATMNATLANSLTRRIQERGQSHDSAQTRVVQDLFQQILKRHCSSAMPPPPVKTRLYKRNAFQNVNSDEETILRRGIAALKSVHGFNPATNTFDFTGGHATSVMSNISRALQIIETGKISLMHRVALETLENLPTCKVVIAVNQSETVKDLKDLFAKESFETVVVQGSMSDTQRTTSMNRFQEANSACRVLIANQSVISTGVDLDDKHGSQPRFCFVSPNQSTITAFQLGHRFQRRDTKSDATVHFVQGKLKGRRWHSSEETVELKVLNSLAHKADIMKETTPEQVSAGILFPSDHETFEDL